MIGMTLCSGIGAPEMAAPWVDWRFASEIEAFPREVLRQRFGYKLPDDHNQGDPLLWGDMTEVDPDLLQRRGIPLPDIIVAGAPCQAFSIAGLRKGTADARGNLTLKFVETCHAIVDARPDGRLVVLWENVPGVLSDKGNAFGCFLGGLVGAVDALPPPNDESWPGEGMVQGPRARAAWAVLDAQHFGVAQRRRRVFVVVDFGNCVDPAAVLLEPESLRGNPPTRGQAGEGIAASVAPSLRGCGVGLERIGDTRGQDPVVAVPDVANPLTARMHKGINTTLDEGQTPIVTHALRGEGFDASEDGTGRGTPIVPVAGAICGGSFTGGAGGRPEGAAAGHFLPVAFAQNTRDEVRLINGDGEIAGALAAETGAKQQSYVAQPYTLTERGRDGLQNLEYRDDGTSNAILTPNGGRGGMGVGAIALPWAVRRLTPTECARLQGFPDDHAQIPWRNKPADQCPDGPQYKAYGNSMAVPVIKYLMDRIKVSFDAMRVR